MPEHAVLIGDNNSGKTTLLEAIDLVLGPDRLNRQPPIDEHDFFQGKYLVNKYTKVTNEAVLDKNTGAESPINQAVAALADDDTVEENPRIEIEATVIGLNDEQKAAFGDFIEFWDSDSNSLYEGEKYNKANLANIDDEKLTEALRLTFHGWYNQPEDDFEGKTYFTRSLTEDERPLLFLKKHKQICGFLYLRSLRTGSRALSLERGSLLDIVLRLKEVRPQMWENTISTLNEFDTTQPDIDDLECGISNVIESINSAVKKYVPKEWGIDPHLKVSNLTREHLRKVITAFVATGEGSHAAPFYRQGTGTTNMLVLAMLSLIAEGKQNVIFAMEEPEIAIPPYTQKRIVHEIRKLADQTLFTSHSPYVIEEFEPDEMIVLSRCLNGLLNQSSVILPENMKLKFYRQGFRTCFSEGLIARRILIGEGATEVSAFSVVCRRLEELKPNTYSSLEVLGICMIDAGSQNNISKIAKLYRGIGKQVFALCDKQSNKNRKLIESQVDMLFMHNEKGFEDLVLNNTSEKALKRFASQIEWSNHTKAKCQDETSVHDKLRNYFTRNKYCSIADFLAQCSEAEIPEWLRRTCIQLKETCMSNLTNHVEVDAFATSGTETESHINAID